MTSPPAISVVIPVRNGARWIGEQLAALADQDFSGEWEVVVADNGSTDETRALVERWADGFPVPLRLADASGRPGISHARNTGLLAATAPLVAFCDCDDRAAPGWLAGAVDGLAELDMVSGLTRLLTDPVDPEAEILKLDVDVSRAVTSCNFAVQRTAYLSVGGFDEGLPVYGCEEFELAIRAEKAGLRIGQTRSMVMHFRRTDRLRTTVRKVYASAIAEAVVWQRHPDRFADRLSLGYPIRSLARLPVTWLREARTGEWVEVRGAVRRVVTLIGNAAGLVRLRRGEYAEPSLIEHPGPR